MIESQSKFPARDSARVANGIRYRKVVTWIQTRVHGWHLTAKGARVAHLTRVCASALRDILAELQLFSHLSRARAAAGAGLRDGSLFGRFALHLVVVLLALGVVAITQVSLPEVDFLLPTPTPAPELGDRTVTTMTTNRGVDRTVSSSAAPLFPAPVAHTVRTERDRMQVITYTVQPNDNVWAVAQGFGLKAETVLWANPKVESSPDMLSVGQVLLIPPIDGIYYTVQQGDTVDKLAKTYQTTVEKIVGSELNALEAPYTLAVGQQIMLPDGRKKVTVATSNYYPMTKVGKAPAGAPTGSGKFAWPTNGYLSQRYWGGHEAIDIANRVGVAILAADSGYVVQAGRDTWGYGNQVLIDHGNGYYTRYAHLDKIHVKAGDSVSKNQQIGTMGNTGRSTGPHLHFEVIYNGVRRNPLGFLP